MRGIPGGTILVTHLQTGLRFCRCAVALLVVVAASACTGGQQEAPAATTAAPAPAAADAPIPDTASPLDALPEAVRLVIDKPFTGDFDEMVKRRAIRVGVTFNRTHYFIDKGQERGLTYEALKSFENDLNTDLKTGNLKVHVVIVPMSRDLLAPVPLERQGRHDRGHGDGPARAGGDRGLLRADAHQREPGGGHRAGSAVDCHGGRSGRPGGVRPKGQRVLRHPHQAERAIESTRQARGDHRRGSRRARRRRHPRDGQCRPRPDHGRGRLPGRVLEPGVHRHHRSQGRRRAHRRPPGRRLSQGESQAPGGRQRLDPEAPERRRLPEHHRTPLSPERQVREERRGRRRAQEARRRWASSSRSTGRSTRSTTC